MFLRVCQGARRGVLAVGRAASDRTGQTSRKGAKAQRRRHGASYLRAPLRAFAPLREHPRPLAAAACLLACLGLGGCRGGADAAPEVAVAHEVSPSPPAVGPSSVVLTLTGEGGRPVTGARVGVEGNMSHPGMAPVIAEAAEIAPGRYRADMEFTMAGDWVLSVSADLPDGRSVRRQLDVRGVEAR